VTTTQEQTHPMRVGDRTHRIIGALLRVQLSNERALRTVEITRTASQVFSDYPITHRTREAYFDAVTAAGVYLNRFAPQYPWTLEAIEMAVGDSRLDIVHQLEGNYLIDEVKLGVTRTGEQSVQQQIARYLALGNDLWRSSFLGVRLCALHEPFQTRLYLPDGHSSVPFVESALHESLALR